MQNLCRIGQKMMQAKTRIENLQVYVNGYHCAKASTTTISSAKIHITCRLDKQTDIIHANNAKTRPIYTKILMNRISQC